MKRFLTLIVALLIISASAEAKPNIILVVADNLGYGDVGCFGSKVNRTPILDQMAAEGIKLTSFYVGSSVCTPSRAAFMTGCYPARVSMEISGTRRPVIQPVAQKGLAPGETTIAEVLKTKDYATMCIGKWHLGDQPQFLPTKQGFDSWLGVPYSEDMIATTAPRLGEMWPPVPLVRNETVIEAPVDPDILTKRYTEEAIRFIKEQKDSPFFLYLPHAVPGSSTEAFASKEFRERSQNGVYGACIEELDWSMGEILGCLKEEGIDENTLVVWTSDNGAFQGNKRIPPLGQNTPLKGTGGTAYEGGFRVPCIARWPGKIPAGQVNNELLTSMDLLPTFASLSEAELSPNTEIDGKNIWPVLAGTESAKSPHEVFYYYKATQLKAVRSGKWKLHLPINTNAPRPQVAPRFEKAQLYDLEADVEEENNLAADHPEIVEKLTLLAEKGREDLGDIGRPGREQRPAGWLDNVESLRIPGLPGDRWFPSDSIPLITPGAGVSAWTPESLSGWAAASSVALDVENPKQLAVSAVEGDAVLHNLADDPSGKKGEALQSKQSFGDLELHVEFQIASGSNSGVYLMGQYEVQIIDSFGKPDAELSYGDHGGIYQRWDEERDPKGYEGTPPKTNASRPAGEWQSLDIVFEAPRFDDKGAKIKPATFVEVKLNGTVIHENVTCSGPTRGGLSPDETATGPLVFQGNHGPVGFRNVWVREKTKP